MSYTKEKDKAIKLRKRGFSLTVISKKLSVSKSTISLWCRGIYLFKNQLNSLKKLQLLKTMKGRLLGAQMNKKKKMNSIEDARAYAKNQINNLTKRDMMMVMIGLFWGEGAKTASRFLFINSDPKMILLVKNILQEVFCVDISDIKLTLQINKIHQHRVDNIKAFWADLLNIPTTNVFRVYYIKTPLKKSYPNFDNHKGTIRLLVARGSKLQYKMLELINRIAEVAQSVRAVVS